MFKAHGYAAHDQHSHLVPFSFERRAPGVNDVVIEFSTPASATPTCTRRATTGVARSTRWCRATKSSAA
jgi:hypothetical protein